MNEHRKISLFLHHFACDKLARIYSNCLIETAAPWPALASAKRPMMTLDKHRQRDG
jgi:hypothetical protein